MSSGELAEMIRPLEVVIAGHQLAVEDVPVHGLGDVAVLDRQRTSRQVTTGNSSLKPEPVARMIRLNSSMTMRAPSGRCRR